MRSSELLARIRKDWMHAVSHRLARGEGVRESFLQPLGRFFDLLLQAVETGDPAWLNPVLDEWVEARTQTELENRENSLPPILDHILLATFDVARDGLDETDALNVVGALLPIYTRAIGYTNLKETGLHVEHISGELEKAQVTLERLDKSKSDFIAIAAHELKTPLTLIDGYTAMLHERLPGGGGVELEILLNGIDNGTRRLGEIVDDMIDVSMIDNNLLSLNFQPVWIDQLLHQVGREFSQPVEQRRQALIIEAFAGCDEMTFGDGERLFQALRNVISNAIKYTPDGGSIRVSGRKLPGFLEITVQDSGIGIDPENQAKIFEKFGRLGNVSLHSSGKTKFKGGGPGLGLSITKGIIDAHGGAIWVESERQDEMNCPGTIFHILLPIRKAPPDHITRKLFHPLTEVGDEKR